MFQLQNVSIEFSYIFHAINNICTPQNILPVVYSMLNLFYTTYDRTVSLTNVHVIRQYLT